LTVNVLAKITLLELGEAMPSRLTANVLVKTTLLELEEAMRTDHRHRMRAVSFGRKKHNLKH
jgi:hypothetical protein